MEEHIEQRNIYFYKTNPGQNPNNLYNNVNKINIFKKFRNKIHLQ